MRKQKSFKNFLTSIFPYFVLVLLGFFRVKVLIGNLGDEIYAINQLFYQIFVYISLAEAGAGTYIVQMYYKYFAKNDKGSVIAIYKSSKKFFSRIAIIVLAVGLAISFGLKLFTNNSLSLLYMQIVFILFVLKNIVEYLMLAPKYVIEADQKSYVINLRFYGFRILEYIVDIVLLSLGFDYVVILIGEIIMRFLTYLVTDHKVFKEYPWLKGDTSKVIPIKGISNMLWHRISEAIHYNTDIIISSSFLSPFFVTVYSSYNYITKYLTDATDMVITSMSSSFGNVLYKEDRNNVIRIFEELNIFFFFIAAFLSTMVMILSNSFVNVWIGGRYCISTIVLVIFVLNFFIVVARKPVNMFRTSNGLFKETKVIVMCEAIINLILSILLVVRFKLLGILLATLISMVFTTCWYVPRYIYRNCLKISPWKYYVKFFAFISLSILVGLTGKYCLSMINVDNIFIWIVVALGFSVVVGGLYFGVCYIFFDDFKNITKKMLSLVFHINKREKAV